MRTKKRLSGSASLFLRGGVSKIRVNYQSQDPPLLVRVCCQPATPSHTQPRAASHTCAQHPLENAVGWDGRAGKDHKVDSTLKPRLQLPHCHLASYVSLTRCNEGPSDINKSLDGSTYPRCIITPFSHHQNFFSLVQFATGYHPGPVAAPMADGASLPIYP